MTSSSDPIAITCDSLKPSIENPYISPATVPPDAVANAVKTSLQDNYPHDRAVGYVVGEPPGAVSIKQPLHE